MRCLIDFPCEDGQRLQGWLVEPRAVLVARRHDDIISLLQAIDTHTQQGRWVVGMMAYEAASAFDPAMPRLSPLPDVPLAAFAVFDDSHFQSASFRRPLLAFTCTPWRGDTSLAAFNAAIAAIRDDIAAGSYYQTNFTTRLTSDFSGDAEAFFHALRDAQPDGYNLFLDAGAWQIASVSPELFFAWNPKTGAITTRPMKGTAAVGGDLQSSAKDRAENLMIVDLLRNDLSRIADNVRVPELFTVQHLPTAVQMTSTITATTRPNVKLADIFAALFPCGSITGAPKIAAMQAIARYEFAPRGAYCGAMGVIRPDGTALFSVGIRSVTIANNIATCGIGSGITWDSNSADEYAENQIKQRFLWRASASFALLETLRLQDGTYALLSRHRDRICHSAAYFGFVFAVEKFDAALATCAADNPQGLFRVRLLADRHGVIRTEVYPLEPMKAINSLLSTSPPFIPPASGVEYTCPLVTLASQPVASTDEFLRHKTTHRAVYEAAASRDPAIYDTLLFNERDEVTEFTRGNVVVELDGQRVTPPLSCGLLGGTLRAELVERGELTERIITRADLHRATGLWFLNSVRGVVAVHMSV